MYIPIHIFNMYANILAYMSILCNSKKLKVSHIITIIVCFVKFNYNFEFNNYSFYKTNYNS